ncbi:hypothetical protein CF335_g2609 [Tilletia laevis]|nr:hypothetical protein CF335_g2609 [Tilletia laevis]
MNNDTAPPGSGSGFTSDAQLQADIIRFQVDSISNTTGLVLADGIWLGLLISVLIFHFTLPELRRKARIIYWIHIISLLLSILCCALAFVLAQWVSIGYVQEPDQFAPDDNSNVHPDAMRRRRMAAVLTILALFTPILIDYILVLKVLAFYPKTVASKWTRVRAAGVPVLCLIIRVPLTAFTSWLGLSLGKLSFTDRSAKPRTFLYIAGYFYLAFELLGNGWCTYILIQKSYAFKCHSNRSKQQARNFRFLIEATLLSFVPALLVQLGLLITGIIGITDTSINLSSLDSILNANHFIHTLKHLLTANVAVSCICSIIATQYPHVRVEWNRKADGTNSNPDRTHSAAHSSQVRRPSTVKVEPFVTGTNEKGEDIEIQMTPRSERKPALGEGWMSRTKSSGSGSNPVRSQGAHSDASLPMTPFTESLGHDDRSTH